MFWKAGIDVPCAARRPEKVLLPVMHRARTWLRSRESVCKLHKDYAENWFPNPMKRTSQKRGVLKNENNLFPEGGTSSTVEMSPLCAIVGDARRLLWQ